MLFSWVFSVLWLLPVLSKFGPARPEEGCLSNHPALQRAVDAGMAVCDCFKVRKGEASACRQCLTHPAHKNSPLLNVESVCARPWTPPPTPLHSAPPHPTSERSCAALNPPPPHSRQMKRVPSGFMPVRTASGGRGDGEADDDGEEGEEDGGGMRVELTDMR